MKDTSNNAALKAVEYADRLIQALDHHQIASFEPEAEKVLRFFQPGEVAELLGVTNAAIRKMVSEGKVEDAKVIVKGRRYYSAKEILELRAAFEKQTRKAGNYQKGRGQGEKLQVLMMMNFKGGSSKTTSTIHLAHYLALQGYRVLTIDLDPQASLTSFFGMRLELDIDTINTVYSALKYDDPISMKECCHKTYFPNLDIMPSDLMLQSYEHETAAQMGTSGGGLYFERLKLALEDVSNDYDIVLIDSPPQLGILTLSGLAAATGIIVPIVPGMLDICSTGQFLKMTGELMSVMSESGIEISFDFMKFLITRHEPADGPQQEMVAFLRGLFGQDVMTHSILKSTAISDAGLNRQSLFEVERADMNRRTYDRAMESLKGVGQEIEDLLNNAWDRSQ